MRKGSRMTKESKEKISNSLRGLVASRETRQKMSAAHTGFRHSKEVKERISKIQKGRIHKPHEGYQKGHVFYKGGEKGWFTKDKRKPLSLEIKKKIGEANREEKHGQWKGDKVGYGGLHNWVRRHLGKPSYCAYCQNSAREPRSYHWANISHAYKRELSDWIRLCSSCHKLYDNGKIKL